MTPTELRALADALHWVQYTADWQACDQAADYLRAQADAQPVAPQAEPKREPLTLEQIDSLIERLFYHLRYESNRVLWEHAVSIVRAVEHAHGIGDSYEHQ